MRNAPSSCVCPAMNGTEWNRFCWISSCGCAGRKGFFRSESNRGAKAKGNKSMVCNESGHGADETSCNDKTNLPKWIFGHRWFLQPSSFSNSLAIYLKNLLGIPNVWQQSECNAKLHRFSQPSRTKPILIALWLDGTILNIPKIYT